MAILNQLSKNYAKALFNIAKESGKVDEVTSQLQKFADNFPPRFAAELKNPAISTNEFLAIAQEVTKKIGVSGLAADFVNVVFKNRKAHYFAAIFAQFISLTKQHNNILQIEIISATQVNDENIAKIKEVVSKQHEGKEIEVTQTIKKQILGGIQIKIGSNLIDASVKSQLDQLEDELIATIN